MNLIFKTEFGSTVYGTRLPTSDTDYKGIYLPSAEDILLQKIRRTVVTNTKLDKNAKNSSEDVDTELFSLDQYLKLLLEGQTVAIDLLFTPTRHHIHAGAGFYWWMEIQKHRSEFIHSGTTSFVGYCQTQAAKYGIKGSRIASVRSTLEYLKQFPEHKKLLEIKPELDKFVPPNSDLIKYVMILHPKRGQHELHLEVCNRKLPLHVNVKYAVTILQRIFDQYGARALLAEKNEGVDWKALSHAVRICNEAKELLSTGFITFPRPEAEFLKKIRLGELPYKEVADLIENGLTELEDIKLTSKLRREPNRKLADELICAAYREMVKW